MRDKLTLKYPVIVEGKYDKIKLSAIVESPILSVDGFAVFNSREKKKLLYTMCSNGAIILTDSDKAGFFLRSRLKGILKSDIEIYNAYIPCIEGKERRKKEASKQGLLGVEGISADVLYEILEKYSKPTPKKEKMTKADMYELGLSGCENAAQSRAILCEQLGLPDCLSANALLEYINNFSEPDYIRSLKALWLKNNDA